MYTLSYKKKKSNNISSFKIQGNALARMNITPVEDCIVDFGDGTTQTYTGNNSSTLVTHNYSKENTYTIKIIGNHSHFIAPINISEIIQLANSVTDCSSMFNNCRSLTEIPSTLKIPNSVTNCSNMFFRCPNLTAISEGFTIPNSVTNCLNMFSDCPITSDISNIWPSTWNYTGTINISNMFFNCSKVVGTVPADKLWNSGKTFNSTGCFRYCTLLTNYAEIPNSWK